MIESINPTTEKLIETFKEFSKEKINEIIEKSIIAKKQWSNKSKQERINVILNMKEIFIKNKDKLIKTINEECGFSVEDIEAVFFDVIDGLSATVYLDDFSKPLLKEHNVLYVDGLVVVDELLVTGNGPAAATAFGEQIVEILNEK